ncbi:VacJ family lipoprotein [Sphingomonas sp.]|uniref:MlaA family lipoprotein n=1 Tax=Sphingomonas sp. TaxID=28214 RepID=UPI000DB3541B|nr:VacJ family lipoprotein [Sphingomonas sp.]PZU08533.1 MAG: VacJ family lipoprotein [Sphingomonas sp.]
MTSRAPTPFVAVVALSLISGGCATVPGQDRLAARDPLEKFNRGVWGVNQAADKVVIKPVTKVYRAVAPKPVRSGVSNFFSNVSEPWSFVNNLLQGKPKRAMQNFGRFLVNTTIGVGGLFDVASKKGIDPAPEDFGQTLARWGVNGGPYLVLPLLGPSTLRDGVGSAVAWGADPVNVGIREADVPNKAALGYRGAYVIDARSQLIDSGADAFLKSSLDPYATARSAYLQRRRSAIMDQENALDAGPPDEEEPMGESAAMPADGNLTEPTPAANGSEVGAPPVAEGAAPAAGPAPTADPAPAPTEPPK